MWIKAIYIDYIHIECFLTFSYEIIIHNLHQYKI